MSLLGDLENCETLYRDGKRIADVDIYYRRGNIWSIHDIDTGVVTEHIGWEECLRVMYHEYKADKIIRRGQMYF